MANEQIINFFREKHSRAIAGGIDWAAKRDDWLRSVETLYDSIELDYLGSADIHSLVRVDRSRVKLVEELHVGSYSTHEMILAVGDEEVLFSPRGTNVAGAAGRVDVYGDRGEATLIRQTDHTWSLVMARTPQLLLLPLNDESFLQLLQKVMR